MGKLINQQSVLMRRLNEKKKFLVGFEECYSYLGQRSGIQVSMLWR